MSDYLGNLAARSLAQAPRVEPRLPASFEAPRPALGLFVGAGAGETDTDEVPSPPIELNAQTLRPSAQPPPRFALAPTPPADPVVSGPPWQDTLHNVAMSFERLLGRPPVAAMAPTVPFVPASPAQRLATPANAVAEPVSSSLASPPQPHVDARRHFEEAVQPVSAAVPALPLRSIRGDAVPPRSERPERRLVPSDPDITGTRHAVAADSLRPSALSRAASGDGRTAPPPVPPQMLAQPRGVPSVESARSVLGGHGVPAESAPTIQVTIGRVEVRAVHASPGPPSPRATPEASRLSLEDYLQERDGVRR